MGKPPVNRAFHLLLVKRGASSRRRCAGSSLSLKRSVSSRMCRISSRSVESQRAREELEKKVGDGRENIGKVILQKSAPPVAVAVSAQAEPVPWDTHTARSPFLLILTSHVPNSSLNALAEVLLLASVASSVAMGIETRLVDASVEFRPTLATCSCSKVAATAAGTAAEAHACACLSRVRALPCAQASALSVRHAARHHRLSGRPRSRAPSSLKHARSHGQSV